MSGERLFLMGLTAFIFGFSMWFLASTPKEPVPEMGTGTVIVDETELTLIIEGDSCYLTSFNRSSEINVICKYGVNTRTFHNLGLGAKVSEFYQMDNGDWKVVVLQ